ncbi:MAG: alpha/beta hydrolase [Bacteroidota bacterium]
MEPPSTQPRLLTLTDLWGARRFDWWQHYEKRLGAHWEIEHYDATELAQIDLQRYEEEALHRQFVNGGIVRAVAELLRREAGRPPAHVLAFSVGATIAWRALRAGLSARFLLAVSATRLRYESDFPQVPGVLLYGANDPYRPASDWLPHCPLPTLLLPEVGHDCYRRIDWIPPILNQLPTPNSKPLR